MTTISDNLQQVRNRISKACTDVGRSIDSVNLLAVSKTFGPEAVRAAHAAGQLAFGENYIQEGVEKILALSDLRLEWHCIGPIQSNKTRLVASHFDWVQSVDRLKIAQRLSDQRPNSLDALNVCIQVNIDGGITKSGVPAAEVLPLARQILVLPRLCLRGIMCIPDPAVNQSAQSAPLLMARELFNALNREGLHLDTLSMGMSSDLEAAVKSGSTMVRVGSAIFGTRDYAAKT